MNLVGVGVFIVMAVGIIWLVNWSSKKAQSETQQRAQQEAARRCIVCGHADPVLPIPRPHYSRRDVGQVGIGVMPPRATVRAFGEPELCTDCSPLCTRLLEQHLAEEYATLSTTCAQLAARAARFEGGGMIAAARAQYFEMEQGVTGRKRQKATAITKAAP